MFPDTTVSIPLPVKKSNLSPKLTVPTVEVSSVILIKEFAKFAFVMPAEPLKFVFVRPDIVFVPAAILLFVNVSVVSRATRVRVPVGKVIVPEFEIVDMTGNVKVLFVNVSVEVSVTILLSKPIVIVSP